MDDDPVGSLQNYKLQLQQVEAALTTDPENAELLKLKEDLQEVIALTSDLAKAYTEELEKKQAGKKKNEASGSGTGVRKDWKIGDRCLAIWSQDGLYYDATVGEVDLAAGEVTVLFDSYQHSETLKIEQLRDLEQKESLKRKMTEGLMAGSKMKKQMMQQQKEYLKKKKQKKQQRMKEIEEVRETEKNKWLSFTNKSSSKKGVVKKSIFASPETTGGRVGVGTCGIGGKPMTEYSAADKWKRASK
ncbi:survival of motor neuron-related-splicing factor 30 [Neocloeon triangulifer]|uniref:survival of motor neuron-related-splicing factor 30 n=1 Tax=Neocloeon triangulifer TaxID=2078957 RepID=UPI00286ED381|nr:survival of motor neuron-related-splicing factor 30 [Neocloeon triangulifer]XP_059486318.1 survival of motor neuron-related-splicing factor 30 [Neocloeon triangulifer]XP_059486319.1 survival of motor neuron-related-splicing factor 30 [Neocloeon triangulifer]